MNSEQFKYEKKIETINKTTNKKSVIQFKISIVYNNRKGSNNSQTTITNMKQVIKVELKFNKI